MKSWEAAHVLHAARFDVTETLRAATPVLTLTNPIACLSVSLLNVVPGRAGFVPRCTCMHAYAGFADQINTSSRYRKMILNTMQQSLKLRSQHSPPQTLRNKKKTHCESRLPRRRMGPSAPRSRVGGAASCHRRIIIFGYYCQTHVARASIAVLANVE